MDRESLNGKVALVTGGGGGIGQAVCKKLANMGIFVYVNDVSDAGKGVVDEINKRNNSKSACFMQYDISNKDFVEEMFEEIKKQHKGVDILINNAAIYGPLCKFYEMPYGDFLKTIEVDLSGAIYCTLLALPYMIQNGWGRIIFTAAPLSSSGIPAPYLAGKAGFIGLTKFIAKKFKEVSTFGLALRHADTPLIRKVLRSRGKDVESGLKELNKKSLIGRMIAPEEVAEIYSYFLTSLGESLRGTVILADGGITYLR